MYKDEKKMFPPYISEFLSEIKFEIKKIKDKSKQKQILENWDNKEHFLEEIGDTLSIAINEYF